MRKKIDELLESSRQVIADACLDNGAIVAANTTKPYYPRQAVNYFFVWPRDAAFVAMAAHELGQTGVLPRFLDWISARAEGWQETGLLWTNYNPHGIQEVRTYQPDQAGALLWAIHYCLGGGALAQEYSGMITKTADALAAEWNGRCFARTVNNIWEGRYAHPEYEENFSYTLAATSGGLYKAYELTGKTEHKKAADGMRQVLLESMESYGYIVSRFGQFSNTAVNASALGLVYPYALLEPQEPAMEATINKIKTELAKDYKVYRSQYDRYDGWVKRGRKMNKGAGYWPLLNFWMSIVLNRQNKRAEAEKYFGKVLEDVGNHIPEQIFNNNIQQGVSPLAWSHAMFVLASKELGYLD